MLLRFGLRKTSLSSPNLMRMGRPTGPPAPRAPPQQCDDINPLRPVTCLLLPARQVFLQPAAGRGSTVLTVRTGSGVGTSGRQADYEFRAGAGSFAMGRDSAPVQLHKGLHQGEAESEAARPFLPGALPEQVE